jgi:hypothetical protein
MIITDWTAITEYTSGAVLSHLEYLRDRRAALSTDRIAQIRAYELRIAEAERWLMVLNRRATETMDSQQALTPRELELLDRGLGAWSSDYNDAPGKEIAALRERLKVFARDVTAERARREQDLHEAFVAGWLGGENSVYVGEGVNPVSEPSSPAEPAAVEYARSKVGG